MEELLQLNPDGIQVRYRATGDAEGNIVERSVEVTVNAISAAGLRNGVFDYADKLACGKEA